MLTFISLKDAKDRRQDGCSGFCCWWEVVCMCTDFIENLRRVASQLAAILNLSFIIRDITAIKCQGMCGVLRGTVIPVNFVYCS